MSTYDINTDGTGFGHVLGMAHEVHAEDAMSMKFVYNVLGWYTHC